MFIKGNRINVVVTVMSFICGIAVMGTFRCTYNGRNWHRYVYSSPITALKPPAANKNQKTCTKAFDLEHIQCDFPPSAFDKVYESGYWSGAKLKNAGPAYYYTKDHHSMSGGGSDKGYPTERSLAFLKKVLTEESVRSMLDVPCGDVNWQFDAWEIDSLENYVGLDVVRPVIAMNEQRFCHHSNKIFRPWNFATCKQLPKIVDSSNARGTRPFDLIHVRDVTQHMPLQEALAALYSIVSSGARFMVTTTFERDSIADEGAQGPRQKGSAPKKVKVPYQLRWAYVNHQIGNGQMHPYDLSADPFEIPEPVRCVETHPEHEADLTCLFRLDTPEFAAWAQKVRKQLGQLASKKQLDSGR